MNTFKIIKNFRFFASLERPILLGRWNSVYSLRKSELSNHDHCGTCPTKMVVPAENEPKWTPELCKHLKYDERYTDIHCSIYENKK
jgi:hypothetical protein